MPISATQGIVSSLDYSSLIKNLVQIKEEPLLALEKDIDRYKSTSSSFSRLEGYISDFKAAADKLRVDPDDPDPTKTSIFTSLTSTSSDADIVTATVATTASPGAYEVVVNSLAKAEKIAADGVATESTVIYSGPGTDFSFQLGTGPVETVTVDGTTTLTSLRDDINALASDVTATIVNDGDPTNPFRLILTSSVTGASNNINITSNNTSLTFSTTLQAAADSSITVDNLAISRDTNTIEGVITGVTLNIESASPGTIVDLEVKRDSELIKGEITTFVNKYNDIVRFVSDNNRFDTETKVAGSFFGDSTVRVLMDTLRREMTSAVTGLPDEYSRLSGIGITSDTEGIFSVDTAKLDDLMVTNFDDIINIFTDDGVTTGFGQNLFEKTESALDPTYGGIINRQKGFTTIIENLEKTLEEKDRELVEYAEKIRLQFATLETLLQSIKGQTTFIQNLSAPPTR